MRPRKPRKPLTQQAREVVDELLRRGKARDDGSPPGRGLPPDDPQRAVTAAWMPFQKAPLGAPRKTEDDELVERARARAAGKPRLFGLSLRIEALIASGLTESEARQRAGRNQLTDAERDRIEALAKRAQRKKRRTE